MKDLLKLIKQPGQNEDFDANTSADCDPLIGQYEMQVSTNDGSVLDSTTFTIVDSRT